MAGRRVWKKRIAEFIIASPWETGPEDDADFEIVLDPGVVFANGLHPTTKDCLNAISYLKKQYSLEIKSVLPENKLTIENEWDHEMTWYTLLLRGLYGR